MQSLASLSRRQDEVNQLKPVSYHITVSSNFHTPIDPADSTAAPKEHYDHIYMPGLRLKLLRFRGRTSLAAVRSLLLRTHGTSISLEWTVILGAAQEEGADRGVHPGGQGGGRLRDQGQVVQGHGQRECFALRPPSRMTTIYL